MDFSDELYIKILGKSCRAKYMDSENVERDYLKTVLMVVQPSRFQVTIYNTALKILSSYVQYIYLYIYLPQMKNNEK